MEHPHIAVDIQTKQKYVEVVKCSDAISIIEKIHAFAVPSHVSRNNGHWFMQNYAREI